MSRKKIDCQLCVKSCKQPSSAVVMECEKYRRNSKESPPKKQVRQLQTSLLDLINIEDSTGWNTTYPATKEQAEQKYDAMTADGRICDSPTETSDGWVVRWKHTKKSRKKEMQEESQKQKELQKLAQAL